MRLVGRIDGGPAKSTVRLPENAEGIHIVAAGDTLSRLARAAGTTVAELMKLNPQVKDANLIRIGERIQLPKLPQTSPAPEAVVTPEPKPEVPVAELPAAAVVVQGAPAAPGSSGVVDRAVSEARQLLTKAVTTDHAFNKQIALGTFGTGTVHLKTSATTDHGYDMSRSRFAEEAEKSGKRAVFVTTEGSLALNGAHTFTSGAEGGTGTSVGVRANASAGFTLTRGHLLDKKNPDGAVLAKDILRTSTTELPLSSKQALTMEPGAAFTLSLAADAAVDASRGDGKVNGAANDRLEVSARFLGDKKVEIQVERESEREGHASISRDKDGKRGSARADATNSSNQTTTYTLDLSKPAGAAAYEALLRGKTKTAELEGKKEGSGVTRGYGWGYQTRERLVEATGGFGGTEDKPTKLDVSLKGTSRTTTDLESGARTMRRSLGADVDLTTPIKEGTVLGLTGDAERSTELVIPGTVKVEGDVALPLNAQTARALPEGARFELRGRGTIGATVAVDRDKARTNDEGEESGRTVTALDGKLSRTGDVEVDVTRGADSKVDVEVTVRSTVKREVDASHTRTKRVTVGLSGSDRRTTIKEETATLKLDLDKPEHRAAYDAALRGDLGPARALGPEVVRDKHLWSRDTNLGVDLNKGETVRFKADWQREVLSTDDWRVSSDEDRQATLTAAKESGEDLRWVSVSTAIAPGARVSFGSVGKIGFDASGELKVRALLPEGDKTRLLPELPITGEDALALPRGAEVTLNGRAKVSAMWGVTHGVDVEAAIARASASVSFTHEQIIVDRAIEVTVKRLDGTKVEVRLDEARATGHKNSVEARVGVDVNLDVIPGAAALNKVPLGGTLLDKAEDAVDRNLSLAFVSERERRKTTSTGINMTLDLASPEGKAAYAAFIRGNADPALALVAKKKKAEPPVAELPAADGDGKPSAAVTPGGTPGGTPAGTPAETPVATVDSRRETKRTESSSRTALTIAGDPIFLRQALRSDATTIESWSGGTTTTTDISTYLKNHKGLVSKGELRVDAVRVSTDEAPEGRSYFHVRVTGTDKWTSTRDMKELVTLGESLGATPVRTMKVEADDKRGVRKIFGSAARHGTTNTELELFVTEKAINELRKKSGGDGARAYARFLERVDGAAPSWAGPQGERAKEMIGAWERTRGSNEPDAENIRTAYWHTFKRNIWEDAETLESAQAIARAIEGMKKSDDPVQWNRTFADLGKKLDVDITGAVAAINELVGSEEVLVHRFIVKGRSVDVEMKDEGLLTP